MHIGLVIDDLYPASGGISRSLQTQIEELVRLGYQPTLIVPKYQLEKPTNCQVIVVPAYYLSILPTHFCTIKSNNRLAKKISQQHKFDIIHSQTDRGAVRLAYRIAKLQNIPHVHTFHSNIAGIQFTNPFSAKLASLLYALVFSRFNPEGGATKKLLADKSAPFFTKLAWQSLARIATSVDAFSAPSQFFIDGIKSAILNPDNYISRIIPTGVNRTLKQHIDSEKRQRKDGKVRFLSIGRLSKEKRTDITVRAFILANITNSELVVIGDGDQKPQLETLAKDYSQITFKGHVKDVKKIAHELKNADVFVLNSYRFDTQGIVIMEAISAGLPILYCDDRLDTLGGSSNSILTGPSIEEIAKGMRQIADPKILSRLTGGSRRLADLTSAETTAKTYLDLYEATLKKYASRN